MNSYFLALLQKNQTFKAESWRVCHTNNMLTLLGKGIKENQKH